MKPTISIILIVLLSVFISCEKDTPEVANHKGKIKRKLEYMSTRDTIPRNISDYEYDSKDRLVKIMSYRGSELFEYNQNDELIRKCNYQIDGNSSTLSDTTTYKYQNGNLVYEERIGVPLTGHSNSFQTNYEYDNSKLIKKKEYRNHTIEIMTLYEYSGSLCTRENHYFDTIGSNLIHYRNNLYDNGILSVSELIVVQGGVYDGLPIQVIYYLYDEKGNLIIESAEQAEYISASLSYLKRYEYY